jgi:hypothetical protein
MEIILEYTWTVQKISNVPKYAHVSIRSVYEHVFHCLPPQYQIRDLINLIVGYFEPNGFMIQVMVDMQHMLTQRNQDAFFIYDVLSRVDPVPSVFTIPSVLLPWLSQETVEKEKTTNQIESASCPRLFIRDHITGVDYYRTRTGHLGLFQDLMTRAHSVHFRGQLSYVRPNLRQFKETQSYLILCSKIDIVSWMNLCPCHRTRQYQEHHHEKGRVLILDRDCAIPPEVRAFSWDNVILDQMSMSVWTTCISDPTDTSRVTGNMGETIPMYHSIIQNCGMVHYISTVKNMNYLRILECMMYLRATYDDRLLVCPGIFSVNRQVIIRMCENLFALKSTV